MVYIHHTGPGRHRVPRTARTRVMRIREHWIPYVFLVLCAFLAIAFGIQWADNQFDGVHSLPTVQTVEAPSILAEPTCPSGYKWSKHASKCYIPPIELPNKINAIPASKSK